MLTQQPIEALGKAIGWSNNPSPTTFAHVTCPLCDQLNFFSLFFGRTTPKCGKCHQPLKVKVPESEVSPVGLF